jgi:hypothetical protein
LAVDVKIRDNILALFPSLSLPPPTRQGHQNAKDIIMAVLPWCPGLNVEILVDGQPLPEYDDMDDSPTHPNRITKYIEAQPGAEFVTRAIFDGEFRFPASDIEIGVEIDGKSPGGTRTHFYEEDFYRSEGVKVDGYSVLHSTVFHKFRFAAINVGKKSNVLCRKFYLTGVIQWRISNIHMSSSSQKHLNL